MLNTTSRNFWIDVNYESIPDPGDGSLGSNCGRVELAPGAGCLKGAVIGGVAGHNAGHPIARRRWRCVRSSHSRARLRRRRHPRRAGASGEKRRELVVARRVCAPTGPF